MKRTRSSLIQRGWIYYFIMLFLFALGMYWMQIAGATLSNNSWHPLTFQAEVPTEQVNPEHVPAVLKESVFAAPWKQITDNLSQPISIALFQIIIIIAFSRIFSFLMRQVGQPAVIGEILAGIFLGPSLLGLLFPDLWTSLFPLASIGNLHSISTIGLSMFMFIIGLELDVSMLNRRIQTALFVSHASILIPFFLGVLLSFELYAGFAQGGTRFLTFSLFMGVSMSITAFPVLARIIQERNLNRTPLGMMAITCAAIDDVSAWCVLAVVIAIAKAGTMTSAFTTILLATGYVIFMLKVVRPYLAKTGNQTSADGQVKQSFIALAIFGLLTSAFLAEIIGIHSLFGAFLAGVSMPQQSRIREALRTKIEDISLLLFLPIFFAHTGLRTQIGLLMSDGLWKICLLVITCAVAGKVTGTLFAARIMGQSWKNSFALGALMNTRGLMELVVLNIGYDLGIITPGLFVVLVLMAIVTTLMTGPLLGLIDYIWPEKGKPELKATLEESKEASLVLD